MALTLNGSPTATSATCNYSAVGQFTKPNNPSYTFTQNGALFPANPTNSQTIQLRYMIADKIEYGDLIYSWSFSSGLPTTASGISGQHTFTGLSSGQRITISATVSCTYSKKTTRLNRTDYRTRNAGTDTTPPGAWSSWYTGEDVIEGSVTTTTVTAEGSPKTFSLNIITRPAQFAWGDGVAQGKTIQVPGGLTAAKWNELADRTAQWKNWKNQNTSANYDSAKVSSGDVISASKYNIIADALGVSRVEGKTNRSDGTVITAAVFIALQNAVNSS